MTTVPNLLTLSFPADHPVPARRTQQLDAPEPQMPNAHTFFADDEPIVSRSDWLPSLPVTVEGSATCAHAVPFQRSIRADSGPLVVVAYAPAPQASPAASAWTANRIPMSPVGAGTAASIRQPVAAASAGSTPAVSAPAAMPDVIKARRRAGASMDTSQERGQQRQDASFM